MGKCRNFIMPLLAVLITLGFFGCMAGVFLLKLDTINRDVLNVLCGVLGTVWVQAISFYFSPKNKKDE